MKDDEISAQSPPVRSRTLSETSGGFEITAVVYELGGDCLVILYGGAKPHIGAVGMGQVRPSLADPEVISATSSVFTYVGHKEDMVAKMASEDLTRRLGRNTVVAAGIHWDNISPEGIKHVRTACRTLIDKIVSEVSRPEPHA